MHGLINRSIQLFLRDTYGSGLWLRVARAAGAGPDGFEAMVIYDDAITGKVVDAAAALLGRPREAVLEDLGTYLVSHAERERLRRLLRFGGVTFADFLHSLDDLPGRGRLALPDLDLPHLSLRPEGQGRFRLLSASPLPGVGHVIAGLLRAMADDYGALVLIEHGGPADGPPDRFSEVVLIHLLDQRFATGRRFDLGAEAG